MRLAVTELPIALNLGMLKVCKSCFVAKPLEDFYKNSEMKDGLTSRCKRCIINASGVLHEKNKAGSAVRDLGCSVEFLKQYLESKFLPGMTWENWAKRGWHIDHITPLDTFDLTNREQFLQCCHYTNLQPLWWRDNLSKGTKI